MSPIRLPMKVTQFSLRLSLLGSLALAAGCASTDSKDAPMSVEDARRMVAEFQAMEFKAPPRTVDDVLENLERHEHLAVEERAALIAEADTPIDPNSGTHERMTSLYARARAARQLGRNGQELADLREAARIIERWDEREGFPPSPSFADAVFRDAAWAESFDGQHGRAVELFRKASKLPALHGSGAAMGDWRELSGLALVTARGGDLDEANEIARQANRAIERANDYQHVYGGYDPQRRLIRPDRHNPWRRIYVRSIEGALLEIEGRWAEAEPHIRDAAATYRLELGGGTLGVYVLGREAEWGALQRSQLAANLTRQGRLLEAEDIVRTALTEELASHGTNAKTVAILLLRLTDVLMARGRFDEAGELALRTISILQTLRTPGSSRLMGEAHYQRAASLALRGDWSAANAGYTGVRAAFLENPSTFARSFAGDPTALLTRVKAGESSKALAEIERTLLRQRGNKGESHYHVLELQGIAAAALAELGESARALALFRETVPRLMEAERANRSALEQRLDSQRRLQVIVESYLELVVTTAPVGESKERNVAVAEAFRVAGYLQAGAVQAAIARSAARNAQSNPELADLIRAEQDAKLQLEATYALMGEAQMGKGGRSEVVASLRERASGLRRSGEALRQEIASRYPAYDDLVNPTPPEIGDTRILLAEDEALLVFYVGESQTYVWGVRRKGPVRFAAVKLGREELDSRVRALRGSLESDAETLGDIPDFDVTLARQIYVTLVEPVEASLVDATTVTVVPHGSLSYLPLSLLVTDDVQVGEDARLLFDRYRAVPWFARKQSLSRVPSIASLKAQRSTRPQDTSGRAFVGFGDPIFGGSGGRADGVRRSAMASERARALVVRSQPHTRSASSATLENLPPLPETRDELLAMANSLGADPRRDVHLGRDATEERVKRTRLSDYRVVAFATHGLAAGDLDGLMQPALALTSPKVAGGQGDGLLSMEEVLGLKMNADWVVLSACNTAAADGAAAEALSGLGRAFFYAGARALLVSNWPVHSQATTELTTTVFRSQASNAELTRSQALQQGMLALIDHKVYRDSDGRALFSYAHPIFWAPFTLVGDGG